MNEDIDDIIEKSVFKNIKKMENIDLDNMPINIWDGIYVITIDSDHRYIGSSRDIFREIRYTISRFKLSSKIKNVSIYTCRDKSQAKNLENFLIEKINPELNYIGRTDRSPNTRPNSNTRSNSDARFSTLLVDKDIKELIISTQKIIWNKNRINIDLKDLVHLAFKRPEKVIDLIYENFSIDMNSNNENENATV